MGLLAIYFGYPDAAVWALAAVPIALVYLLTVRLRREWVTTGRLWEQVFAAEPARPIRRGIRRWASLAVQLAIVGLLVLALADPWSRPPRRAVVVIDTSASMAAIDGDKTRLDRAREAARGMLAGWNREDRMAVIVAGRDVRLHCPITSRREALDEALAELPAPTGAAPISEAVEMARAALGDDEGGEIVVITDGCFSGAAELCQADDVRLVCIGKPEGNVAITRLAARRCPDDPLRCQVLLEAANHSAERRSCTLSVLFGGRPVASSEIALEPNDAYRQVYAMKPDRSGTLSAALTASEPDALESDNFASVWVPPPDILRVALVGEPGVHFQKALGVNPRVKIVEPQPGNKEAVIRVVFGDVPERLPDGPLLVIHPNTPCDLWRIGPALGTTVVEATDGASPVMQHVDLDRVPIAESVRLTAVPDSPAPMKKLAWSADGDPLIGAFERPSGRVLVVAGDVEQGALPLRAGFALLVANGLDWLAGNDRAAGGNFAAAGLDSTDARPGEADLRPPAGLTAEASVAGVAPASLSLRLPLLVAALLALVIEWRLYQRRWMT